MFLELKNTTIGYQTPLIKEVNTSLGLGEICLLIGNNGVGKTTLIKSILNQIELIEGAVLINEKQTQTLTYKEIAEQIAVVFSKSQIPANYTLWDLISFGKYIHYPYYFELNHTDKLEIEEIIESLNLTQYRDFQLSQLSDGNLQKAFIGRALAQNSPMIILDEPTTHLDEENKIIILKLLRNLAKTQNKLILFSSHDWRLAKEFADKIWLISNEKLHAGITEEILLKHNELLNPHIFHFNEGFVAPQIFAPELHKEMLYSFLQKNFKKNLSEFKFVFSNPFWEISTHQIQQKCDSFEEIAEFVQNLH
ncbi:MULTISPECIES: ABC transporter ATP-binding protein [Chryseobacterium]|uniref:Putative siderophore transport system ATP-binding protein YusV n=1 Tax=Chryseobacterium salivictor TaxID=2547600 RepID=A0A4P6ZHH7_9FLAO|nr:MULTISPECIES: ABC transporter ATP-binding protein [Chryseobacterium]MDQ0475601.1 iron complex transport system ATP-binding protein [Chryseobacterium sp. MDT2-18]QBO59028.1 putative siderophore transport system ATP-binding protein YusV [Chryseobacterium salivictor]